MNALALLPAKADTPDGLGALITVPDLHGAAGKTLFEGSSLGAYTIYTDLGFSDIVEKSTSVLYAAAEGIALLLVRLAVALTWWLTQLTTSNGTGAAIGDAVGRVAGGFNAWLLPTALGLGVIVAWAGTKTGRDAVNQVAWVMVLGIACIGLAADGAKVVGGLDTTRTVMAEQGARMGAELVVTDQATARPFAWPGADVRTGDPDKDLARASGDAIWRTFAVRPWCVVQFGSEAACEKYGADWLKLGLDHDAREEYITKTIAKDQGGEDSPTVRYIQGHEPSTRLVLSFFALLESAGLVFVVGGLALSALLTWGSVLLLLFVLPFFLALMVIPGRPRAWGMAFVEVVLGLTLFSALLNALVSAMLLATTGIMEAAGSLGWLPSAMSAFGVLAGAWKGRAILERVMLTGGSGDRGLGAALAARAISSGGRRMLRAGRGTGRAAASDARSAAGVAAAPIRRAGAAAAGRGRQFYEATSRRAHAGMDRFEDRVEGRRPWRGTGGSAGPAGRHGAGGERSAPGTDRSRPGSQRPGDSRGNAGSVRRSGGRGPMDSPRYAMPGDRRTNAGRQPGRGVQDSSASSGVRRVTAGAVRFAERPPRPRPLSGPRYSAEARARQKREAAMQDREQRYIAQRRQQRTTR